MRTRVVTLTLAALVALGAAGPAHARMLINGAGATFPYPIYSKWFDEFHKAHPDLQINYQSIGSGGGIRQMLEGTVDFGATDGPMSDEDLAKAKVPILHFPTVLGAVVVTFNVEGVKHLRLTPDVLADIFLGKITKWSDPALAKDNPGVKLPDVPMVTAHRSDGSGTTYVFTDYLSKVSPAWKKAVGRNTSVSWPVGLGGKGNEGVTGLVKQTPNSIGYVELIYAIQNKLPYAELRNAAGRYITPSLASVTAAAGSAAANMPADFRVSITNGTAPDAYPISSFTWLLIPTHYKKPATGRALKQFLEWMLDTGQTFTKPLSYAPLPSSVVKLERKALDKIKVGGQ